MKMMRAAKYLRVSTDEQTVANQRRVLEEVAGRRGWDIVKEYVDNRISGAKARHLVGRSARGSTAMVTAAMKELNAAGIALYADREGMDTSTPPRTGYVADGVRVRRA